MVAVANMGLGAAAGAEARTVAGQGWWGWQARWWGTCHGSHAFPICIRRRLRPAPVPRRKILWKAVHVAVLLEQRVDLVVGQRRVPQGKVRHLAMEVAKFIEVGNVFIARV